MLGGIYLSINAHKNVNDAFATKSAHINLNISGGHLLSD